MSRNWPDTNVDDIVEQMASWRYEVLLLFLFVNTSFLMIFNQFTKDSDRSQTTARHPKPYFGSASRRLLDFNDFGYVINSDACESRYTPILVHSYVGHFENRRAMRRSYPRSVLNLLGFRYVFMTGLPNSSDVQSRLLRESYLHGDIVQGNFQEAYRNLTYKHIMGLTWFQERCGMATHVVKMDDDIAVNVYRLKEVVARDQELAGCLIDAKPIRDKSNKWYVSREEFAGDTYPAFLSGWLYTAKAVSVMRLLRVIRPENYFWIDDLYVTGVLAQRAGINLTDLRPDFETDPGPVHCCIREQQRCQFLAAPTGEDFTLLQQYPKQLTYCKNINSSCDAFRKSKRHHSCLDLWKRKSTSKRKGKPSIEILN